ncbi:MAG TPA: hypothetical protein VGM54_24930 [Chthoniobacter sp.]
MATVSGADETFKVLGGDSLDGRFGLGYGLNDLTQVPLKDLRETPNDDAEFDQRIDKEVEATEGDPVKLKNYLVDLRTRRAIAVLPGFNDFPQRNHYELEIGWSVDGKTALAIYRQRFGNVAVAWIETRTGRVTPMRDKLEKDFQGVLIQDKGKVYSRHKKDYAISFFDPIVAGSGEVIIGCASAVIPKQDGWLDYALKFRVAKWKGRTHLVLVSAGRGGVWDYDQPLENPKEKMAKAFKRLRNRLHGTERRALEREQAEWQRLVGENGRGLEIDWRARELQLRLDLL